VASLPIPVLSSSTPLDRHITIRPPGSKSLTNRALLLAALAEGTSTLRNALTDADDAQRMLAALTSLGVHITHTRSQMGQALTIRGVAGRFVLPGPLTLDLGNAGTATRFLTAAAMLGNAPITIDGDARMRERPIGELVSALRQCGATVESLGSASCPPIRITAPASLRSIRLDIPTTQSSQFISALLMLGPFLPGGVTIRLLGAITSPSYIDMTIAMLESLGATVRLSDDRHVIRIGPPETHTRLNAFDLDIEPDASGATYFWAAAALVPGLSCTLNAITESSTQGDARFAQVCAQMGAACRADPSGLTVRGTTAPLSPIRIDMERMPDAVMTLAALASFATGPTFVRGVRTLRVKETDRVAALRTELAKINVTVDSPVDGDDDAMLITPPAGGVDCSAAAPAVALDTYRDHRMAMALALIGLRRPNITINDPGCVIKTYATYWSDFARLYHDAPQQ
jgi:3-phosphoshikimate 1-carboxyvinyltransferase